MPITNISSFDYNDTESRIIDKINHNFDEIVEMHGGTIGDIGPTGSDGGIGNSGKLGITGNPGTRGSKWFIDISGPTGIGNAIVENDFWIDSNTGDINTFTETGWEATGYNLAPSGSVFRYDESYFLNGNTGGAIHMNQDALENYLFIVADKVFESGVINEPLAKFIISTDSYNNSGYLLEFSKSDLEDGTLTDYQGHPYWAWKNTGLSDDNIMLQIPDGSFVIGASGGFEVLCNVLNLRSNDYIDIDYSTDSSSGIFATGGFNLNTGISNNFSIESQFINITGGVAGFSSPVRIAPTLNTNLLNAVYLSAGVTGAIKTTRTGDTFNTLSHSTYNVLFETQSDKEFFIDTKGKIKTKKIESGISYPVGTPLVSTGPGAEVWYLISKPGVDSYSAVLDSGNVIVISPPQYVTPGFFGVLGIGVYNEAINSWAGNGLANGESIEITVVCSPTAYTYEGFSFIGKGITAGSITSMVSLPSTSPVVDLTIAKNISGSVTTVFYKAYSIDGGSCLGGSFIL
jgi:hypothetical protein